MAEFDTIREDKVVCPHCWNHFYRDEAKYISNHPTLYGDPLLGSAAPKRQTRQEIRDSDRDGKLYDTAGGTITHRACPVCHLQIPSDVLARRPLFISMVGGPASGKTYFVTSMIHELRDVLVNVFDVALIDSDSDDVRAFLNYEQTLFPGGDPKALVYLEKTAETGELYNKTRIENVEVLLPKPFIFKLSPVSEKAKSIAGGSRSLVVYDNAGEAFGYRKDSDPALGHVTRHLPNADVVLFTFDPLQQKQEREKLRAISLDPQVVQMPHDSTQEMYLIEAVNRIRKHRQMDEGKIPMTLCVCVQKLDVWNLHLNHQWNSKNDAVPTGIAHPLRRPAAKKVDNIGTINSGAVQLTSTLVRKYLNTVNSKLVGIAEASFQRVLYFPVSALGNSPILENDKVPMSRAESPLLKIESGKVKPIRAEVPALWFLAQQELIAWSKYNPKLAKKYKTLEAKGVGNGRIEVCFPSGQTLEMDSTFADGPVIDPGDGRVVWIGRATTPPPKQKAPKLAASDQTPKTETNSLELRLNKAKKKNKRGWGPWGG